MPELLTGTSGWSNREWKPEFYPAALKPGDWLKFYARHLPSVEINSSYYRLPAVPMIARWRERVPAEFRFAVKAWGRITHELKLRNCTAELQEFLGALSLFGDQLGPVLFQLPPKLEFDAELLEKFLQHLPGGYRFVFEFRHASWFCEPTYALLAHHGVALCQSHLQRWALPLTAGPFQYIRLHGAKKLYQGGYDDAFLQALADWIKRQHLPAYVYFNNTMVRPWQCITQSGCCSFARRRKYVIIRSCKRIGN